MGCLTYKIGTLNLKVCWVYCEKSKTRERNRQVTIQIPVKNKGGYTRSQCVEVYEKRRRCSEDVVFATAWLRFSRNRFLDNVTPRIAVRGFL